MNTTHCKRGPQNGHPHMKRLLTALFVAAMVIILAFPAFAADVTGATSEPDTEVSSSTPDLTEPPADEADPTTAQTSGPVRNFYELQDAIAVSAISKCRFSPKLNVVFYGAAYRCYTALYTTSLAGLKPVKPWFISLFQA